LRFVAESAVNKKRVYRLLKENDLLVGKQDSPFGKAREQYTKAAPGAYQQLVGH
jgi:hypothetical protein